MAIQSFRDADTQVFYQTGRNKRWANIAKVTLRKLDMLNAVATLTDLRIPPANRLETLLSNRVGQHCIRINDQWRVCFRWTEAGPADVEITDYH